MELNLHIDVNNPGVLEALGDMLVKLNTLQGTGYVDLQTAAPTSPVERSNAEEPVTIWPRTSPASEQAVQAEPAPKVPVQDKPVYTKDQLARAAQPLMDAGRMEEVSNMMQTKFGVQALHELPEEQYGALAAALREMGAKL